MVRRSLLVNVLSCLARIHCGGVIGHVSVESGGRSAVATAASLLLLIVLGLPAAASQPGASHIPGPRISRIVAAGVARVWRRRRLIARVIVDGECPARLDSLDVDMTRRALLPLPSRSSPVRRLFPSARTASVLNQDLPLPEGPIRRIAVIGDTGCRVNDWEKKYQACNDPEAWPFAQVAETVAVWDPDLIVHVGDYLYRESPCPADFTGCQGNPHGDNWATWDADFFTPAACSSAAPWIFMRGNHETCDRNPGGMVYVPRPTSRYQAACQRFTGPTSSHCMVPRSRSSTPPRPPMSPTLRKRQQSTHALACWRRWRRPDHGW